MPWSPSLQQVMLKDQYKLMHKLEVEIVGFINTVAFCTDLEVYKSMFFVLCSHVGHNSKTKGREGA